MYTLWMFDEIFCRHQLGPFDLLYDLVLEFLYWFFVWITYLLVIREYYSLPLTPCWSLYVFLSLLEYVWWNWVHWHWVHIGW
jgi:hypothetical protein